MEWTHRLLCRVVAVAWLLAASTASSQILPLVVDATEDPVGAWWLADDGRPAGALDRSLFARMEAHPAWLVPAQGRTAREIASVLRTVELTPNNARSLARLYGARVVVVGQVVREAQSPVAWLTLSRSALVLEATVLDTETGAVRDEFALRAVAFGAAPTEADEAAADVLAGLLLRSVAADPRLAAPEGLSEGVPVADVVVFSDGSAIPYVAFRGMLREAHPGILEVRERWATGGQLGLELVLDEGTTRDEVEPRILRLVGARADDLIVVDVSARDEGLAVRVALPSEERGGP